MTRLASLLALSLAVIPSTASAQEPPSISPGARVRVWTSATAEPVTGQLLSLDGKMMTIIGDRSGTPVGVSRDSITRLDVSRGRRSRAKSVGIGALTGLAIGALIGVVGSSSDANSIGPSGPGAGAIILGGLLTPVGAMIGLAVGPGKDVWTTTPTSSKQSQTVAPLAPSLRFSFRF